jgi:hypothetical protein
LIKFILVVLIEYHPYFLGLFGFFLIALLIAVVDDSERNLSFPDVYTGAD